MTFSRSHLRSACWLARDDLGGFIHRAALRGEGFAEELAAGAPVIGICNSWSELVHCNIHLDALARAVKRGVASAGGLPLEFPTISLGETLMKPTAMLFRNLMAMDVEESIRAYPLDSVVLIGGCDKTVPAQLMGAASADVPAIALSGGPAAATVFRGERLGSGTDLWHYLEDLRAGRMSAEEWKELEQAAAPSAGHCTEMGTASTMAAMAEALGMVLPGTAVHPAASPARLAAAEATGRRAVEIAIEGLRPSTILTAAAFDNAIAVLVALGGSTNAVVHLIAIAGRAGIELPLRRFAEVAEQVPLLADVRPAGNGLFEDLDQAGGVRALMRELLPLLHGEAMTVTGARLADNLAFPSRTNGTTIRPLDAPLGPAGGLSVLHGSLAPDGALLKRSAADERLVRHRGPALVFEGIEDLARRIDDPALDVAADTVLVLRGAGPVGGPGMPEWGMLPLPKKLLRAGITDMVRISDARMSGTGFGTVVLHVAPESAVGGPIAHVRSGDLITLDADAGLLDLEVPTAELARRRMQWQPPPPPYRRGYGALFLAHVLQADEGCDFDFLRGSAGPDEREPLGLLGGSIGGW